MSILPDLSRRLKIFGKLTMRKQRIEYDSPVDALIAITKRLSLYENQYQLESEDFFNRYSQGQMGDEANFIQWTNDYQHYMVIRKSEFLNLA